MKHRITLDAVLFLVGAGCGRRINYGVVSVEPGIYVEGRYGCRIEDMIAVLEDGTIHDFTKSPKELIEL